MFVICVLVSLLLILLCILAMPKLKERDLNILLEAFFLDNLETISFFLAFASLFSCP